MITKKILIPRTILILLCLSVILNLARIAIFHSISLIYLLWNIFLAILPFIASSVLLFYHRNGKLISWAGIIGGLIWLLLFPNAPYIVTDLIHMSRGNSILVLYDTVVLFASAWTGLIIGMYSLAHIDEIIGTRYSKKAAHIAVPFIMLFTSFGMYLGRFLRFNSWDVFINPISFGRNVWDVFYQPTQYVSAYIFTLVFFFFLYMSYGAWKHGNLYGHGI
jgi:uncharacterized membrane protein